MFQTTPVHISCIWWHFRLDFNPLKRVDLTLPFTSQQTWWLCIILCQAYCRINVFLNVSSLNTSMLLPHRSCGLYSGLDMSCPKVCSLIQNVFSENLVTAPSRVGKCSEKDSSGFLASPVIVAGCVTVQALIAQSASQSDHGFSAAWLGFLLLWRRPSQISHDFTIETGKQKVWNLMGRSCNELQWVAAAALKLKLQPGYRIAGHLSPEPNWESAVAAVAVAIYSGNGDLCTHYSIIMLFCCHFAAILLPFCYHFAAILPCRPEPLDIQGQRTLQIASIRRVWVVLVDKDPRIGQATPRQIPPEVKHTNLRDSDRSCLINNIQQHPDLHGFARAMVPTLPKALLEAKQIQTGSTVIGKHCAQLSGKAYTLEEEAR